MPFRNAVRPAARIFVVLLVMTAALGEGCATSGKFESKILTWKGKDPDTVVHCLGQTDTTEKLSNGNRMYVYARLKHAPLSFKDVDGTSSSAEAHRTASAADVYLKCSSYFEIDPQGKVASVYFRGEDC